MRAGLARIQMAGRSRELSDHSAHGPTTLAQMAFLFGRAYGHWEAGKVESVDVPDAKALAAEVRADPALKQQLDELRELGRDVTRRLADTLHYAAGEADADDLLSQWEGFGRFCRETLGMEPLTVAQAYGLQHEDPDAKVRKTCLDAAVDPTKVDA
jgi:hypothetical protein